ncbi:anti-sigma factor [Halobacillus sp. A1]|uniref:anti-sigma factor n=1 Tax=Halobacillus sp. A1 TaxID=2880262 RepID=UPI0020A6D7D8|nr:anti-sigma factor [Halobacillus sp. A1]MCP3031833.1 anti-sigma factor [Halobacillus sp. A1]
MRNECDVVIDYFNDQLNEDEKKAFEAHLENCKDCQEELEELRLLTGDLPFAAEPVDPPEGMKERVLTSVFSESTEESDDEAPVTKPAETPVVPMSKQTASKSKRNSWVMRGLAAALLLSLAGNIYALVNEQDIAEQPEDPEEVTPPEEDEGTDQVAERVQLQGESSASATAAMINRDNGGILTLQAEQLEQLDGEEVYQVWLLEGETPHRAGSFISNENGDGAVAYSMEGLPEGIDWDAVAITKEPDANSETPQGNILLSAEL